MGSGDTEWRVSEVICLKCYYRWIAVRPALTLLKDMQCPCCHNIWYVIETGEELEEYEYGRNQN